MQNFYGKIRAFHSEERIIEIEDKKRILYFRLTRNQLKKFDAYLQEGIYVVFKAYDTPKQYGKYISYEIFNFIKIVSHTGKKVITYYDVDTIKEGVRKLLKKDNYKLFIDLEFTMPPYNYSHGQTPAFYSEIIQYGMYVEDGDGRIIDESEGLIRPKCELGLSDRTVDFLKINKNKLLEAPYYSEFYNELRSLMLRYQPTIFIWGKNDYLMIEKSYELHNVPPVTSRKNFVNLMQIIKNYYNIKNDIGLYAAYDLLGSKPLLRVQDHNALHDAQATLDIYHLFEKEINTK